MGTDEDTDADPVEHTEGCANNDMRTKMRIRTRTRGHSKRRVRRYTYRRVQSPAYRREHRCANRRAHQWAYDANTNAHPQIRTKMRAQRCR